MDFEKLTQDTNKEEKQFKQAAAVSLLAEMGEQKFDAMTPQDQQDAMKDKVAYLKLHQRKEP